MTKTAGFFFNFINNRKQNKHKNFPSKPESKKILQYKWVVPAHGADEESVFRRGVDFRNDAEPQRYSYGASIKWFTSKTISHMMRKKMYSLNYN